MAKIAFGQFTAQNDRDYNLGRVTDHIAEAGTRGADVVCFHEIANTIYCCFRNDEAFRQLAEPEDGVSVTRVRAAAAKAGVAVVYPFYESTDNGQKLYNTAVMIDREGNIVGKYRKMSIPQILRTVTEGETPADERFYFLPGDLGFPVFDVAGLKIGIMICYDRHFPEAARCLALQGAEIVFVPTATYRPWIRNVWQIELAAHAIANGMYVAGINRVGMERGGAPDRSYFGSSLVIDPMGTTIAVATDHDEELWCVDIDPATAHRVRELWGFFEARRPDAYGLLTAPVGAESRAAV